MNICDMNYIYDVYGQAQYSSQHELAVVQKSQSYKANQSKD